MMLFQHSCKLFSKCTMSSAYKLTDTLHKKKLVPNNLQQHIDLLNSSKYHQILRPNTIVIMWAIKQILFYGLIKCQTNGFFTIMMHTLQCSYKCFEQMWINKKLTLLEFVFFFLNKN